MTAVVSENDDGNQRTPTTDQVFEILKNRRRRAVIRYLDSHDGYGELSDVAEHIAAAENDTTVQQLGSQERKRVRIALYQCHLPKMDSVGIIDYDGDRGTIRLRDSAAEMQRYLQWDPVDDHGDPSLDPALTAFVAGVVILVTTGTFGIGPLSAVPPPGWTLVSVLAIVVIVGRQYWDGTGAPRP